ncbi:hypothetical protein KSP40_PGU012725 [Platanthera guangdongensis]|uniref:Uncharacterized protein n=1 Tax=Platanthera guangdongensis TaxID=2320717 RepID=A0ABR2MKW3_9ASPA
MDLETENHLAALLMEEARRLRREADKDGVHVYLHKTNVRGRPNSRFLTATVLGVEQANRATEISEMWRAREKERELDAKTKRESKRKSIGVHIRNSFASDDSRPAGQEISAITCSFNERQDSYSRGNVGLDDDELEQFLHSRMKRGRGSIGCRMDEPGPYLTSTSTDHDERIVGSPAERYGQECMRSRAILGPEKPHFLKSRESHDEVGTSKIQTSKKYHYEEKKKSKREKSENNKTRKESKSKHQKAETNGDRRKSKVYV